jgi:hypothetical protein
MVSDALPAPRLMVACALAFTLHFLALPQLDLMRMGQGGHFLSDVIFSFYAVYFTAWTLWRFMTRAGRVLSPLD